MLNCFPLFGSVQTLRYGQSSWKTDFFSDKKINKVIVLFVRLIYAVRLKMTRVQCKIPILRRCPDVSALEMRNLCT